MVALKQQLFQYNLKKNFLRRLAFPMLFFLFSWRSLLTSKYLR